MNDGREPSAELDDTVLQAIAELAEVADAAKDCAEMLSALALELHGW